MSAARRSPWNRAAGVIAGLSFVFAAFSLGSLRRDAAALEDRARVARDLAALEAEAAELRRWQGICAERARAAGPADLSALARAYLPADSIRLAARPARPLGEPGWDWVEVEVQFTAVDFERIAKFLAAAESEPLPWRIQQLRLEAVTPAASTGSLTLGRLQSGGAEPNEG